MAEYGVKKYFNLSEKYWNKRGVVVSFVEKVEERFVRKKIKFHKNDIVLDFACGLGRWSSIIDKKVKKVVAIDIAPKLIKQLKNKNLKNVQTFVGSDYLLKQYPNYFNKIIFAQALEFYKSPINLFKLFYRSLKKDGQIFLSTWSPQILSNIKIKNNFVIVKRPSDNKSIKVFFKPWNKKEIVVLMKKAGFREIKVEILRLIIKDLPSKIKKNFSTESPSRLINILIVARAIKG